MVRVTAERLRDDSVELGFDLLRRLAGREAGAVADPEDVGVHRERLFAPRRVEDDVRRLPPDARKSLQQISVARHLSAVTFDQRLGKRDHVLCLGVEQTDGLDRGS